jgi:competence protein ComFC
MSLLSALIDFLFPKRAQVLHLESLSTEKLLQILPPATLEHGDTIALFSYQDPLVKELIWEVKYAGNSILASRLGEILYDVIESELMERNIFEKYHNVILLPMPISDKRRNERGWNQTELVCEEVKKLDSAQHFKYLPRQLCKIRHTESQTRTASRQERKENLHDSMLVMHPPAVAEKCVVLVDDVTTTGSTFAEAKRALREAGARKIICFALAH